MEEPLIKIEDIAKALGVEFTPDEDANTFVSKVVTKQRELILNDSSVIQPIKESAVKEAEIVALKKSKKTIATSLGLGYSNSELAEKSIEDLINEGTQSLKNSDKTPAEIKTLQEKLMAVSSEFEDFKTKHVQETESIHQTYKRKEAESYFEKELVAELTKDNKKFHIGLPSVIEIVTNRIKGNVFPVKEDGVLKFVDANGNQLLNDAKTALLTIEDIAKKADDLQIKSNGKGERKEFELPNNPNISDKMKANRERLASTYIE